MNNYAKVIAFLGILENLPFWPFLSILIRAGVGSCCISFDRSRRAGHEYVTHLSVPTA